MCNHKERDSLGIAQFVPGSVAIMVFHDIFGTARAKLSSRCYLLGETPALVGSPHFALEGFTRQGITQSTVGFR